jgi:3-oxoacyl-[acyl-carrier-protein] synthase II
VIGTGGTGAEQTGAGATLARPAGRRGDLVVTGLGVSLPGVADPAGALPAGERPVTAAAPDWFDLATALPGRGYRWLPRACQYLLAAARAALGDAGDPLTGVPPERRGLVVGTNNAIATLLDEMDTAVVERDADELSPLTAPYVAMSVVVSRLAIEHAIRGFSLTVNSPRTAGLEALQHAARTLTAGRADIFVVGATEEVLPDNEPGHDRSDVGAVAMVCAPAASVAGKAGKVYGTCRVRTAFLGPGISPGGALDGPWRLLCGTTDEAPPVTAVLDDSPTGAAVGEWLSGRATRLTTAPAGSGCLSPLRHLVGLLATVDSDRLVVTAAAEGNVALCRLTPAAGIERPDGGS